VRWIESSGRTLAFKAMPEGSEGKAQGLMAMSHQLVFLSARRSAVSSLIWIHWRGSSSYCAAEPGWNGASFYRTLRCEHQRETVG
jgi:hypothetical protein